MCCSYQACGVDNIITIINYSHKTNVSPLLTPAHVNWPPMTLTAAMATTNDSSVDNYPHVKSLVLYTSIG